MILAVEKEGAPTPAKATGAQRNGTTSTDTLRTSMLVNPDNACQDRMSPTKLLIDQLPPTDQELIARLVEQLAERNGISASIAATVLHPPAEHFERFLADLELRGYSNTTIANYRVHVGLLLREYPAPTADDLRDYFERILKSADGDWEAVEKHKATISAKMAMFRGYFKWLVDNGYWTENPVRRLKWPKLAKRERVVPKDVSIAKLLQTEMSDEDRLVIQLFLDCGIRVSECITLTWGRCDIDGLKIRVLGKGNKERYVPISPSTAFALQKRATDLKLDEDDYVFPGHSKGSHMHRRTVQDRMDKLCRKAGIPHIHPHLLRHYVATALLDRGADLKAVSEFLGHADVVITLTTYHHVGQKKVDAMHNRFGLMSREVPQLTDGEPIIEGEVREIE